MRRAFCKTQRHRSLFWLKMTTKRQKLGASIAQAAGLRISAAAVGRVASLLRNTADYDADSIHNSHCRDLSNWFQDITTPFGQLFVDLDVPMCDGSTYKWRVASPYALLWHLVSVSVAFGALLEGCIDGVLSDIALWGDEVCSGNQLRPDDHNRHVLIYWTFHQLPSWWRSVDEGWFPLGSMAYTTIQDVKGKYSGLLRVVLKYVLLGHTLNQKRCMSQQVRAQVARLDNVG